ncbi:MAG: MFS transporter [Sphingobacteriales bacterium]|nr:MFS transporter [Sphingobacteriales bacterium]OJY86129.1 MAG: MFS transporter [Sphingobacteriales bacterium 44-15]
MKIRTLPVYMIFLTMGLIDSVGPMVSLAKESFKISTTIASLLPMLGYMMYGLLSIPTGLLQDKKGKKFIMNLGLSIALAGLFIPIISGMSGKMIIDHSSLSQFYKILAAILMLGAGGAILQVSGNPIMRDFSEPGQYSRNLSFAQSFITVGSSLGFLLPVIMLRAFGLDWSILFPVFAGIVLTGIIWLNMLRIREGNDTDKHATVRSCFRLLKNSYILIMVVGIFIYCGIEISMSAYVPILLKEKYNVSVEKIGLLIGWSLFYLPILSGRFLGAWIMSRIAPTRLLLFTVLFSFLGFTLIFSNSFVLTLFGIFVIGLGFANIFPLLFSITIEYMPDHANELSGLMVSAITGGAFIPPVMGVVADGASIQTAFLVPVVCILYLLFVAVVNNVHVSKNRSIIV